MISNLQLISSNFDRGMQSGFHPDPATRGLTTPPTSDEKLLDAYSQAVISVVDKVSSAVVNIDVKRQLKSRRRNNQSVAQVHGNGSGCIFTGDGYILTNSHVVHNATKIEVMLSDGRRFPAELIGDDPDTDSAVIRIHAPNLVAARLGDSQSLKAGQLAMGDKPPLALAQLAIPTASNAV